MYFHKDARTPFQNTRMPLKYRFAVGTHRSRAATRSNETVCDGRSVLHLASSPGQPFPRIVFCMYFKFFRNAHIDGARRLPFYFILNC